jgi:hypothetical protein
VLEFVVVGLEATQEVEGGESEQTEQHVVGGVLGDCLVLASFNCGVLLLCLTHQLHVFGVAHEFPH